MDLNFKRIIINRKLQIFLVWTLIIFVVSFGNSISAETNSNGYNINITDAKVSKYFVVAYNSKDSVVQINNYMLASNAIKKIPLTKDNAVLLAYINYQIGKSAKEILKFDMAIKAYWKSYTVLKFKNIHKNNKLAFLDLLNLFYLAQVSNNEKFEHYYSKELITTQVKLEKSYPCEFKDVYNSLYGYYSKEKNSKKANFYKQKAFNLCKTPSN